MMQDDNKINVGYSGVPEPMNVIDLMVRLWRGKLIIIITTIVVLILATGYIFLVKEKWISTAIITQPDAGQISNYTHALNVIYGNNTPKINDTQSSIIQRFGSSFSALSETLDNQETPEKLTIDEAVKGQSLPLKVTYTGPTAESAQKTLATYIQQVDDEVAKGLEHDLVSMIKSRKIDLEQSLKTQEKVVTEQKNLRIAQIVQALTVAEQSNIKMPNVQQMDQVSQDTLFMLGSDALSSMIKNESTRPLPYPDSYYQTRQALFDVTDLEVGDKADEIKADNLHSYRYVMKPTLPVHRDSPKRALTLILAVLFGGMIGAGIVLVKDSLRGYRAVN